MTNVHGPDRVRIDHMDDQQGRPAYRRLPRPPYPTGSAAFRIALQATDLSASSTGTEMCTVMHEDYAETGEAAKMEGEDDGHARAR
jgi:hypothetical protein